MGDKHKVRVYPRAPALPLKWTGSAPVAPKKGLFVYVTHAARATAAQQNIRLPSPPTVN